MAPYNSSDADDNDETPQRRLPANDSDSPNQSSELYIPGQLLLATPVIGDGIFKKGVILLTEHDKSGAHGIMLNHPLPKKVGQLLDDPKLAPLHDLDVHLGGPVARAHLTFTALTWDRDDNLLRTFTRISSREAIERLDDPQTRVGAYVGYSGWEAQQLENELYHQSWLPIPPNENLITGTHQASLWTNTLTQAGPRYELIAQAPEDPFQN